MNHKLIIDTIISNNGTIIGGYVREWLSNGEPSDKDWNDIDIKCSKESELIIKEKINKIYPNLFLDFSPSLFSGYRNPYSCNLIQYDGEFKTVKYLGEEDFVDLTRKKICKYLRKSNVGRILSLESRLINNGWTIEFPNIINSNK